MTENEFRFEYVPIKDLPALASKTINGALAGTFIPITKHRAEAMAANPFADPDDVGMVVAYWEGKLVGYFGIMPIMLKCGSAFSKAHWFTTWNVSPLVRGRGLGSMLMRESLKLGLDFMIVGSRPARIVSEKFGFKQLKALKIALIDFSSLWRYNPFSLVLRGFRKIMYITLGKEIDILKATRRFERGFHFILGWLVKGIFYSIVLNRYQEVLKSFRVEQVERVREEEHETLINSEGVRFYRGPKIINWMLSKPWVVRTGESDSEELDFYFSDARLIFENLAFEVFSSNTYQGFIVFQFTKIRNLKVLKVLDMGLLNHEWILPLALQLGKTKGADRIEMNLSYAEEFASSTAARLIIRNHERIYQCHPRSEDSPLGMCWREIELDYTDGDLAFS